MSDMSKTDLPPALPWAHRYKGVLPLPGGYDRYLEWLTEVCNFIETHRPRQVELRGWVQDGYSLTEGSADLRVGFLHKVGLLESSGETSRVAALTRRWLQDGDSSLIIAQVHSRTRFIGEMLNESHAAEISGGNLRTSELLHIANVRYDCGWFSSSQIDNRRGWLQSAGMLRMNAENRFAITSAGQDLLQRLDVYEPPLPATAPGPAVVRASPEFTEPSGAPIGTAHSPEPEELLSSGAPPILLEPAPTIASALADELQAAATDSINPTRFELAVRDAFEFLGFRAEQLGGSGSTDVLLDAPRGKGHTYRVTVDAKSVGAGSSNKGQLRDQQVDWETLKEHRNQYSATYSLLIGPDPAGERLFDRGRKSNVAIMSSDELAQLCRQHEESPLGLGDYECLFTAGGAVDLSPINESFEEATRRRDLAEAVCRALIDECADLGPMSARDLRLTLKHQDAEQSWAEDEISEVLATLSSDLVGAIEAVPTPDKSATTYIPATSLQVAQLRLRKLADALGTDLQGPDDVLTPVGGRTGGSIGRAAAVAAVRAERDSR